MLDVINKKEYFLWNDKRIADRNNHSLKGIQDAWLISQFGSKSDLKIAEIGGGDSRVLIRLKQKNECWNIDKFEGVGCGPTDIPEMANIKMVKSYMGDFDINIPRNYFDVLFSISVIEHVPIDKVMLFFQDCYRVLKPGGIMAHAIDAYVRDVPTKRLEIIELYKQAVETQGFEWDSPPKIDKNLRFKSTFASNSDLTLAGWNRLAPSLRSTREDSQSISIKLLAYKKR